MGRMKKVAAWEYLRFQKQGMGVIYGRNIQNCDSFIGAYVDLERLPSYDR